MAKYHYLKLDNIDEAELIYWLLEETLFKCYIPEEFRKVDISKLCSRIDLMDWEEGQT